MRPGKSQIHLFLMQTVWSLKWMQKKRFKAGMQNVSCKERTR